MKRYAEKEASYGIKKQDHTRPIEKRGDDPDIETLFDNRNCNAVPFFSAV